MLPGILAFWSRAPIPPKTKKKKKKGMMNIAELEAREVHKLAECSLHTPMGVFMACLLNFL